MQNRSREQIVVRKVKSERFLNDVKTGIVKLRKKSIEYLFRESSKSRNRKVAEKA